MLSESEGFSTLIDLDDDADIQIQFAVQQHVAYRERMRLLHEEQKKRCKPLSRKQRAEILKCDKCCKLCGSFENLEVDHIVARANGGDNDSGNLQVLCRECHKRKHGAHSAWRERKVRA